MEVVLLEAEDDVYDRYWTDQLTSLPSGVYQLVE